jgi:hypothetical protein
MKGQTALEYLITYGWAVAVIMVVLMVVWYYGVFDSSIWNTISPYTCENLSETYPIAYCDDLSYPRINCMLPDNQTVCRCEVGALGKLVLSECEIVLNPR